MRFAFLTYGLKIALATVLVLVFGSRNFVSATDADSRNQVSPALSTLSARVVPGKVTVVQMSDLTASERLFLNPGRILKARTPFLEQELGDKQPNLLQRAAKIIKSHQGKPEKDAFLPSSTTNPPFSDLVFLGRVPEGVGPNGTAVRITRLFAAPSGLMVMLTEWAYKLAGGGILMIREYQNQRVRGHLAMLSLQKSTTGHAVWKLTRASGEKNYELYMEDKITDDTDLSRAVEKITALATSLEE